MLRINYSLELSEIHVYLFTWEYEFLFNNLVSQNNPTYIAKLAKLVILIMPFCALWPCLFEVEVFLFTLGTFVHTFQQILQFQAYCKHNLWQNFYEIRKIISILRMTLKNTVLIEKRVKHFLLHQHVHKCWKYVNKQIL